MSNQPFMSLVLKGIAGAMGAAAAVISILGTGSPNTLVTLLGIGLFCLAIWGPSRRVNVFMPQANAKPNRIPICGFQLFRIRAVPNPGGVS